MTPYERDPRDDLDVLHRDIGPRLSPEAGRRWRRVGAAIYAVFLVLGLPMMVAYTGMILGVPAAIAHAAVLLGLLWLTRDRVPDPLVWTTIALVGVGFVVFFLLLPRFDDASDPLARAAMRQATLAFRIPATFLWIVQTPPALLRRLWRGEPLRDAARNVGKPFRPLHGL